MSTAFNPDPETAAKGRQLAWAALEPGIPSEEVLNRLGGALIGLSGGALWAVLGVALTDTGSAAGQAAPRCFECGEEAPWVMLARVEGAGGTLRALAVLYHCVRHRPVEMAQGFQLGQQRCWAKTKQVPSPEWTLGGSSGTVPGQEP